MIYADISRDPETTHRQGRLINHPCDGTIVRVLHALPHVHILQLSHLGVQVGEGTIHKTPEGWIGRCSENAGGWKVTSADGSRLVFEEEKAEDVSAYNLMAAANGSEI